MLCPRCSGKNPSQARFCLECGAKLELTCQSPIDIIVIDRGMRVSEIFRDLQTCTQCPIIYSVSETAGYALEINAGLAEKLGITIEDTFVFGNE